MSPRIERIAKNMDQVHHNAVVHHRCEPLEMDNKKAFLRIDDEILIYVEIG